MSSFNNALKNIKLRYLAIFIVVTYLILSLLANFTHMRGTNFLYVIVICYFIFVLRGNSQSLKSDIRDIFNQIELKHILLIVFLNICLSYGMLYLSGAIKDYFHFLDYLVNFSVPSMSLVNYLPKIWGFFGTVVISPICEELVFRGVLLNKLKLYVPTVFAIFGSSLFFGALHSFGGMISAVIFAICMAILYIKTENICVPIFAHFLNNLFAEIIRLVDVNNILFTNNLVMGIVSVLAAISAILLIVTIINELNKVK